MKIYLKEGRMPDLGEVDEYILGDDL